MAQRKVFEVGDIRIGNVTGNGGSTLLAADSIGTIQSATFTVEVQETELRASGSVNMYAEDVGFHTAQARLEVTMNVVNTDTIKRILGGTLNTPAITGYTRISGKKTSTPEKFRIELHGTDTDNKAHIVVLYKAYAVGTSLAHALTNFVNPAFTAAGLPGGAADDTALVWDLLQQN